MNRYCFIQIDMDDNQWVTPRQRGISYDVSKSDIFRTSVDNIERFLTPYPLTLFMVGLDMNVEKKVDRISKLLDNHTNIEIANHSLTHFNNFSLLSYDEKKKEIVDSDRLIRESLGLERICGYRSPGYIFNNEIIEILESVEYTYDASLLPSYYGPILRGLNYLIHRVPGKGNFGHFKNGFLPNEPVLLNREKRFYEINISVCPFLRSPIHYSMIKSRRIYRILSPLIEKLRYFNFLFHLYDFMDVDLTKLRYVLDLITSQRKLILSKAL